MSGPSVIFEKSRSFEKMVFELPSFCCSIDWNPVTEYSVQWNYIVHFGHQFFLMWNTRIFLLCIVTNMASKKHQNIDSRQLSLFSAEFDKPKVSKFTTDTPEMISPSNKTSEIVPDKVVRVFCHIDFHLI